MRNNMSQLQLYLRAKEYAHKIFQRVPNYTLENARKLFTTDLYMVVVNEYQLYCKAYEADKASKSLRNALFVNGINISEYGYDLYLLRSTYSEFDSAARQVLLGNNALYKKVIHSLPSKSREILFGLIKQNNKMLRYYDTFVVQRDSVFNKAIINLYSQNTTDIKFALATCNELVDITHTTILKMNNLLLKQKEEVIEKIGGKPNE